MNTLVVSPYNARSVSGAIMLDQLCDVLDGTNAGDAVYLLSCLNSFDICYFNYDRSPATCFRCRVGDARSVRDVAGDYTFLKFGDIISEDDLAVATAFFAECHTIDCHTTYSNFDIGEALLSVYISQTRNRDVDAANSSMYIGVAKVNALALYLGVRRFLRDNDIHEVRSFNGRQDYSRAVLRACEAESVECRNYERTRPGGYVEYFINTIPHDIAAKTAWIDAAWRDGGLSDTDRPLIAGEFFERKRAGGAVVDRSYTSRQARDRLPDVQASDGLVVAFTSSDDEFAAVGPEYDNPYFADQFEGVEYLVDLFGKELTSRTLIVRMHPNLSNVDETYVHAILALGGRYSNVTVLAPDDPSDSYALVDAAEKVVVFGSSIGIEANYWRKPVVLLGKSFYWHLDVAYKPESVSDIPVLMRADLSPKPIEGSLKYGYYAMRGGIKSSRYSQSAPYARPTFEGRPTLPLDWVTRGLARFIALVHRHTGLRLRLAWYK